MAGLVKQTPNSIGYVELIFAVQNKMAFADVKNVAGKFVTPSFEGVTAAAASFERDAGRFPRLDHERSRRRFLSDLDASPGC